MDWVGLLFFIYDSGKKIIKPDDPVPKRSAGHHLTVNLKEKKKLLLASIYVTISWNGKAKHFGTYQGNVWIASSMTEKGKKPDMKNLSSASWKKLGLVSKDIVSSC